MSNNLKKLEKELRSIAKRCKDVKYTKGLLLSFLFMGLFAFSLQASSISPITSMWENYNREKAENDRAMEKANNELLMLMKQGDHVVKSAWPSWQFGFNFMANSQLGVYKGFGGKYEDRKYDRSNDLTKYVFDASKNQYGATTLNIKGNEEAKSMVIDPASVHIRNYANNPAEVTKLDVLGMASDPEFNLNISSPATVTTYTAPNNTPTAPTAPSIVFTPSSLRYDTDTDSTYYTATGLLNVAHEDNDDNTIKTTTTIASTTPITVTGTFWNGISSTYTPLNGSSAYLNYPNNPSQKHGFTELYYAGYSGTINGTSVNGVDAKHRDLTQAYNEYNTRWINVYNYYISQSYTPADAISKANSGVLYQVNNDYVTISYNDTNYTSSPSPVSYRYTGFGENRGSSILINSGVTADISADFNVGNDDGSRDSGIRIAYDGATTTNINGSTIRIGKGSNISGNSTGITIDSIGTPTLNFNNNPVISTDGTVDNVAIHIQKGSLTNAANSVIDINGSVDIYLSGGSNVAYNNMNAVKNLSISNATVTTGIATSFGNNGLISVEGSNNVVFLNSGYVKEAASTIDLDNIQVFGSNNAVSFFNTTSNTHTTNGYGAIGYYMGEIKLQGIIGAFTSLSAARGATSSVVGGSKNNVGIYAVSGQRSGVNTTGIGETSGISLQDINVTDLNIGFGKESRNGILVYAGRGTSIDVKNSTTSNMTISNTITDGVQNITGTLVWGYDTREENVSENTVIAYSDGVFGNHGLSTGSNGRTSDPSQIDLSSNVDMVSKQGIAYFANDGGIINAQATRAGGYKSIIAYSNGSNGTLGNGSKIEIAGNIVAADHNALGAMNNTSSGSTVTVASWVDQNSLGKSYENIAAYAAGGGDVIIGGTTVNTTYTESAANSAPTDSLIYGMAAYATGTGSSVTYNSGVTVVSGTDGALYATDSGTISFQGNILNQNNMGATINTLASSVTNHAGGTRNGKGTGTVDNDHINVTPFYVDRTSGTASITFNGATAIDMYDGILLTGNKYGEAVTDYYKDLTRPSVATEAAKYDVAKYRGMENVNVEILSDRVNLGVINQAKDEIIWDSDKNATTTAGYLKGIADYAGMVGIKNATAAAYAYREGGAYKFDSTLINGKLKIDENVNLEDMDKADNNSATTTAIDPFNDIKMESEYVTIASGKTIKGDVGIVSGSTMLAGQGLNMANSLSRWEDPTIAGTSWIKTNNEQSGYENNGIINVWGGTAKNNGTTAEERITGVNVAYGTVYNTGTGEIKVDHGYAVVGTDDSIIKNEGKITVTGMYVGDDTNAISAKRAAAGFIAETKATGENYGIVGLSTNNVGYGNNAVNIKNIAGTAGTIEVDGDMAVGIYAANVVRSSDATSAKKSDVNITYDNQNTTSADAIKVNNGSSVQNEKNAKGVGIALVSKYKGANADYRGGTITLNTKGGSTSDILTYHNGIGIYGESTDIVFDSASAGLTVETKNNGAGLWMTDDSNVGKLANKEGDKVFNYLYKGDADKNGFGMIFGSTISNLSTTATNWLDIKFTNTGATKEGIAGILVNTDENDRVINYGKITEDTSTTAEKAYGVVVNKGTVENHGDIELNDSTDITKANVGIFANSNDLTADIVNYGNIKVGTPGSTKSFGIYGYNITHGTREDVLSPISGKGGTITIGKESYGIYSGDGTVKVTGGKLIVGDSTVTTASEQAVGVYIDDNTRLSKSARSGEVSADMEIDDYSFGIVVAENQNAKLPGASNTNYLTLGNGTYSVDSAGRTSSLMSTKTPEIIVGRAASRTPVDPDVDPLHTTYTSNSVYYYSADKLSKVDSWADIKMNGDYNYAFYTAGVANNMGTIDLRSKVDVASGSANLGYGNVGIYSTNYSAGASTNYGTITTGMSDLLNEEYSIGMAAGHYNKKTKEITREGHVVNRGIINVQEENGIGMFAVGSNSKAENYGDINLIGNNSIGMYLDRKATGINYGNIVTTGSGTGIKGIVALNGSIIKNYGTIKIEGNGGIAIQTDNLQNKTDNQTSDVYGGTEIGTQESIQYVASSDTKTVGTGSTITVPSSVPLTEVKINGIDTPIFKVDTDATRLFGTATQATVIGSVQSGGTRIIDLSTWGDFGNTRNLAEATRIGMYVDTSGFQYTNPIDGLDNLKNLYEIDLLFGTEATMYTNSKAIQLGDNILTAYNDALKQVVTGGTTLKGLSSSITWLAKPVFNETTGLIDTVYLVKVPYQSYAVEGDDLTYYFAENLESKYDIASGNDKIIFNKLNSIGNGEGHILAQAIDEMKGHQYSNIQQRGQVTRDILFKEINYLRNEWANPSKDSNKIKSFGTKGEYKTDSAGVKDYNNNAYGVAYIHENETLSLGEKSGWYAGAVYNSFNFKDLGGSEEDQALINAGLFKSTPFDQNGSLTWTISGDAYVGLNNMRRRFWVVDKIFSSRANYVSYGVGITNEIAKEFGSVTGSGFSYKPYASVRVEYGRFTDIEEKGDMALEVKGNDYYSIRPEIGMQVKYSQPVFSGKTNFVAGFGVAVENELGKIGDAQNKARISGVYGNYYKLKGEKENRKGNLKTDLSIGLDNRRIGFAINVGYDTKGENLRGGISFRGMF